MLELWIPAANKKPDVGNIYDLMLTFQDHIDRAETHFARYECARFAVDALARASERLPEDSKEVTVLSRLALIDSTEKPGSLLLANNIGLRGTISNIQCVEIEQKIPLSLALKIDVLSVFKPENPDDSDYLLTTANAPISLVEYIATGDDETTPL